MRTATFTAGLLLWTTVRSLLEQAKFAGLDIEWMESSGFFSRDFVIKGSSDDVEIVMENFRNLAERLEDK